MNPVEFAKITEYSIKEFEKWYSEHENEFSKSSKEDLESAYFGASISMLTISLLTTFSY